MSENNHETPRWSKMPTEEKALYRRGDARIGAMNIIVGIIAMVLLSPEASKLEQSEFMVFAGVVLALFVLGVHGIYTSRRDVKTMTELQVATA